MEKISFFFSWLASVRVWFTNWLCWGAELSFCRSDWSMLACDEDRWFVQSPDNCFSRLLSRWFCETNHVEHQMLILHTLYCNSRKKWLVITIMLLIMFKKKELWHRYLWISELRHQNWIRTKKKSRSCLSTESMKAQNTLDVVMLDFVNSRMRKFSTWGLFLEDMDMKIRWNNNIVTLAFKLLNGGLKRVKKKTCFMNKI